MGVLRGCSGGCPKGVHPERVGLRGCTQRGVGRVGGEVVATADPARARLLRVRKLGEAVRSGAELREQPGEVHPLGEVLEALRGRSGGCP